MTEVITVGTHEGACMDVVFVHGLDGDARRSWSGKEPDSFWPAWLAEDVEGIGVWSVGYDASSSKWLGHAMPIQDRAINLLAMLQNHDIGQRPLCFVTHSMGGLLVKEMLLHAAGARTDYADFATATQGVVFIGTPHTGSALLTKAIVKALSTVYWRTPAVKDLERNSAFLRQLNDSYRDWVADAGIDHLVFSETFLTRGVRVVDKESANPHLVGVRPIPIDANHIDICKPGDRNSLVYGQVRRFVTRVLRSSTSQDTAESAHASEGVRAAELNELDNALAAARAGEGPHVVVIAGVGGVGKTVLAEQWARNIAHEGQAAIIIRLNGHGLGQKVGTAGALEQLRAYSNIKGPMPSNQHAAAIEFRSLAAERAAILVLDDAYDERQVRPLLPDSESYFVVVTSRSQLLNLGARHRVKVLQCNTLSSGESLALLQRFLESELHAADLECATQIVRHTAGLPLALWIAACMVKSDVKTIRELAEELSENKTPLDVFYAGDDELGSLRPVFDSSYARLGPDDRRAFRFLGLHTGRGIDTYSLALLTNNRRTPDHTAIALSRSAATGQAAGHP